MTAADPGLLRTIVENPGDTAARLVYADWLEEHGDSDRAEFCHVQCELAKLAPPRIILGGEGDWLNNEGEENKYLCHLQERGGPDYYEADSSLFSPVGSRVDVLCGYLKYGRWKVKTEYGLLVRKVVGQENAWTYTLKRDELSVPWPGEQLRRRERGLLAASWRDWLGFRDDGHLYLDHPPDRYQRELLDGFAGVRFRRGFVEEVRLPLAKWLGEPCEICRGGTIGGGFQAPCIRCEGRGYVGGLGPAIVLAAPITLTEFPELDPFEYVADGGGFQWYDGGREGMVGVHPQSDLPRSIFNELSGCFLKDYRAFYRTREEAVNALSHAAISIARKWAGLPEVKP